MKHLCRRRLIAALVLFTVSVVRAADPLERYVAAPDDAFKWEVKRTVNTNGFTTATLSMTSQTWRTSAWTHTIQIVRPNKMRHPEIAFLFVTGDGAGRTETLLLAKVAAEAGAVAAVVMLMTIS